MCGEQYDCYMFPTANLPTDRCTDEAAHEKTHNTDNFFVTVGA
jgi:hypothetical protein